VQPAITFRATQSAFQPPARPRARREKLGRRAPGTRSGVDPTNGRYERNASLIRPSRKGGSLVPKNPGQARFWSSTAVLPRPGAWPTLLPIRLRRRISSQSNNTGCPWPAAMRPKRSGRRPAGLRDPGANSEVVAETGGDQTSRGPRLGCARVTWRSNKSWAAPRLRPSHLFNFLPHLIRGPAQKSRNFR